MTAHVAKGVAGNAVDAFPASDRAPLLAKIALVAPVFVPGH